MKKLVVIFVGLFIFTLSVFGQTGGSIWDVISNLGSYLGSPEAYAVAVTIVAAFFTGIFKLLKDWPKRLVSWGLSIVGLIVADLLDFGFAAQYPIWEAAVAGLFIGFAANGIFTIPQLKPFMDKIHELAAKISPLK
jgi:hypothetical protein